MNVPGFIVKSLNSLPRSVTEVVQNSFESSFCSSERRWKNLFSTLENSKQFTVVNVTAVVAASAGSWGSRCAQTHTRGRWRTGVQPQPWSRLEEGVCAGGLVEVFPDGVVVHGRSQRHKHVPDGVGEGDDAVALEEEHTEAVDESTAGQLLKALCVALHRTRGKTWDMILGLLD